MAYISTARIDTLPLPAFIKRVNRWCSDSHIIIDSIASERYIERLLLGLLPGEFAFIEDSTSGQWVVVDGEKRLSAIVGYLNNELSVCDKLYNETDNRTLNALDSIYIRYSILEGYQVDNIRPYYI
jgi:hypothetical protein